MAAVAELEFPSPPRPGQLGVVVTPSRGAFTGAQLERLAAIAEAYAFGGLHSAADGRVVVWGLDPTVVTEVVAEVEAVGLEAAPARPAEFNTKAGRHEDSIGRKA